MRYRIALPGGLYLGRAGLGSLLGKVAAPFAYVYDSAADAAGVAAQHGGTVEALPAARPASKPVDDVEPADTMTTERYSPDRVAAEIRLERSRSRPDGRR